MQFCISVSGLSFGRVKHYGKYITLLFNHFIFNFMNFDLQTKFNYQKSFKKLKLNYSSKEIENFVLLKYWTFRYSLRSSLTSDRFSPLDKYQK